MRNRKLLFTGIAMLTFFSIWTVLIQTIDVQDVGVHGTKIGFAAINTWFFRWTGTNRSLYLITDWLGLVPIGVCAFFGFVGLKQWVKRKSLFKVDVDLILLGGYYIIVIISYLVFEMIPINYRPILIDGSMEASYPSSTTLLVFSVMPSLTFQIDRRIEKPALRNAGHGFTAAFSAFMGIGRLLSGVHWCTDILGSVLLSTGLFAIYQWSVGFVDQKNRKAEVPNGI